MTYKDSLLNELAGHANIAQFVSFAPSLEQRFAYIIGYAPNHPFLSTHDAIHALLGSSTAKSVNVRSFQPTQTKNCEFVYGLRNVNDVVACVHRLANAGFYTIVNETIDVQDGGVSGVQYEDCLEFAPGDTPRCVEKPGIMAISQNWGMDLLQTIYGFRPALDYDAGTRVEFSIHPLRCGYRHTNTIIWEVETCGNLGSFVTPTWPNRFSRFLGDKTFGLLVANLLGAKVPYTQVIPRSLPPFSFGQHTGTCETWLRTCPAIPTPGLFTTQRGWCDPFHLLAAEDPHQDIVAVLSQDGIEADYSGALISSESGDLIIEGVRGRGDKFMVGAQEPIVHLPSRVIDSVRDAYDVLALHLGRLRMEWVYDGADTWIVQLHQGATPTSGGVIYPGQPRDWHFFDVCGGLDGLRILISQLQDTDDGIVLMGDVGVTSHLGDVLRKAKIPSKIQHISTTHSDQ